MVDLGCGDLEQATVRLFHAVVLGEDNGGEHVGKAAALWVAVPVGKKAQRVGLSKMCQRWKHVRVELDMFESSFKVERVQVVGQTFVRQSQTCHGATERGEA